MSISRWTETASAQTLGLTRVSLVPLAWLGERLGPRAAVLHGFHGVLIVSALYAIATLAVGVARGGTAAPVWLLGLLDLQLLALLAYESGGAASHLRFAFFVVPMVAALLARPPVAAQWAVLAPLAYLAVAMVPPLRAPAGTVAVQILDLAWLSGCAVAFTVLLDRRAQRVVALDRSRALLATEALDAQLRERQCLAERLHDDALPALLTAKRELEHAGGADLARRAVSRAATGVREAVSDLHPAVLAHTGLERGLHTLAARYGEDAGFEPTVAIDKGALGHHDAVLFSVGRELLANIARHAQARRVLLTLQCDGEHVRLAVTDDGRGLASGAPQKALEQGHIGLATIAQRVAALDGELRVDSEQGLGTQIAVTLPLQGFRSHDVAA